MELKVVRIPKKGASTLGSLFVNGKFQAFTLEDEDRGLTSSMSLSEIKKIKVYGKTCIPYGRYRVTKTWWAKHKRFVPQVNDVKGYSGIFIHSGVTADDSLGCLLVGNKQFKDTLQNSKDARIALDAIIFAALTREEEVWIEYVKADQPV